jgi:hypothetical protein
VSASQARRAIDSFFEGFNARDQQKIRDAFHFPHVRFASGRVMVVEQPSDFHTPFDRLIAAEGWHHSTLDSAEVVHEGPDKVHFDVRFSRYKEDGSRYAEHRSLWIVTRTDDHWGVQGRSSYAP